MKVQAQRLMGTIVLTVAVAAILTGGAVASSGTPAPPDAFERAVNARLATPGPDAFERAVNARYSTPVPDAFERAVANSVRPDDRGELRGPGVVPEQPVSTSSSYLSDARDWSVVATVVLLLAAGLLLTIRHRRRVVLS